MQINWIRVLGTSAVGFGIILLVAWLFAPCGGPF
jgi:hypothetical protein